MSDVRIETPSPHVRLLVMTRASKRNALSLRMIGSLRQAVVAAADDGARALVLAGEGRVFSAGADFADLKGDASDLEFDRAMRGLTSTLAQSPLMSLAAIQGPCIGAGLDLALACDFRVASPAAVFALPAVSLGILYDPERLGELVPRLGRATAMRLLVLGEQLDRHDAVTAGIVTHCTDPAGDTDVLAAALRLAERAASLPPDAQGVAKAFVAAAFEPDFSPGAWQARRLRLLESDERRAALQLANGSRK